MENILLVLNIVFAIILVLLVLMQKSEGGALGIGVSQENFMFSRSAGNFMTKATAVIVCAFVLKLERVCGHVGYGKPCSVKIVGQFVASG